MLKYIDNTESVILRRKNKSEITFPNSLFRPFRSRQRVRIVETLFPSLTAHWYLPKDDALPEPLAGEELIDTSGNLWQILEVRPSPMNHNWQVVALRYTVPIGLEDYFDLLQKVSITTPTGETKDGYVPLRCGIAARFSVPQYIYDRENNVEKESVYVLCREKVEADAAHIVRLANGKMYVIAKIKSAVWTEMEIEVLFQQG
ncbi:MAG: hypothetical protein FWE67_13115 [Planctomycetaceae bacterium]|nr:hypothetical protein [Planctomycetaceae bacterium]